MPGKPSATFLDFLVSLAVDDAVRDAFDNPATREATMTQNGLDNAAKAALRSGSRAEVRDRVLNTQSASTSLQKALIKRAKPAPKRAARKRGK